MKYLLLLITGVLVISPPAARAVTIDLVPIGDPGNSGDIVPGVGIFGRVTSAYQIGSTEITNAEYVEFLNAKAVNNSYGLYNAAMGMFEGGITQTGSEGGYTYSVRSPAVGMGPGGTDYTYDDKPVVYVSWYNAIRFANWMNNGQGSGDTETGAYTLLGGTATPSNADSITRNTGATWFLPSENEWYKAAYYNSATSSYFDYPTGSDATPDNNLPTADSGNSANFLAGSDTTTGDTSHPFTAAGAYTMTMSPYGTFDQGGNVYEWNEALVSTGKRGRRGGAWDTTDSSLLSATRDSLSAALGNFDTGFRLARTIGPPGVPGDYNGNGVVDVADYVLWRNGGPLANEVNTPGVVDASDYTAWRERFGNTSGAGSGSALQSSVVPEPNTWMLLAAVVAILVTFTRCRSLLTHASGR